MRRIRMKRNSSKARKTRMKKGVYDLSDIFDSINIQNAEKVVANNVAYTLRREKILKKNMQVIVPAGGLVSFTGGNEEEHGSVQADFAVYEGHDKIIAVGTAYGLVSAGELLDLTTELYPAT